MGVVMTVNSKAFHFHSPSPRPSPARGEGVSVWTNSPEMPPLLKGGISEICCQFAQNFILMKRINLPRSPAAAGSLAMTKKGLRHSLSKGRENTEFPDGHYLIDVLNQFDTDIIGPVEEGHFPGSGNPGRLSEYKTLFGQFRKSFFQIFNL